MKSVTALLTVFLSCLLLLTEGLNDCQGTLEFYAEPIEPAARKDLILSGIETFTTLTDCIRRCYQREFCRHAIFSPADNQCEMIYTTPRCESRQRVTLYSDPSAQHISVFCIDCRDSQTQTATTGTTTTVSLTPTLSYNRLNSNNNDNNNVNSAVEKVQVQTQQQQQPRTFDATTCFNERPKRELLGATFIEESGVSVEVCKCLCAKTWISGLSHQCHSFQYYQSRRLCALNFADSSNSSFPLLSIETDAIYFDFTCRNKGDLEIPTVTDQMCRELAVLKNNSAASKAQLVQPVPEDKCFVRFDRYLLSGSATFVRHGVTLAGCKCLCAKNALKEEPIENRCRSLMYYSPTQDCILNRNDKNGRPDLFGKDSTLLDVNYYGLECLNANSLQEYVNGFCGNETSSVLSELLSSSKPAQTATINSSNTSGAVRLQENISQLSLLL